MSHQVPLHQLYCDGYTYIVKTVVETSSYSSSKFCTVNL